MRPSQIASTVKVRDVKISPDGKQILYQVQSFYKPDDRYRAELWVALTGVAHSARKVTDGEFYDRLGVFHPTRGNTVVFLSDRHGGRAAALYSLTLPEDCGVNPPALVYGKSGVQQFQISPNGRYVAFTSIGDSTYSTGIRKVGDPAPGLAGLSLLNLDDADSDAVPISMIRGDRHVESFTWSPDSSHILYRLRRDRTPEAAEEEVLLEKVSVDLANAPVTVGSFARSPSGPCLCIGSGLPGFLASLQSYDEEELLDARTLYIHRRGMVRKLYGVDEDAVRIVNMTPESASGGMIAVEVCSDTETRIDGIVFGPSGEYQVVPLFETNQDAIWFGAWDAKRVDDGSFVFSAVLSSGVRHEGPNLWSVVVPTGRSRRPEATNGEVNGSRAMHCLSEHLQWLVDEPRIHTEVITWNAQDGTVLSGLVRYPPGYSADNESKEMLPTVMFLHGGPYRRDVPDYMPYFCNWRELLASAGYLVISPNYRGSQGRGHKFAHSANMGIGSLDWDDCEGMLNEVIGRGIADPKRLGIAGWSHGGSMTAWGVTNTKNRFNAAVVGAGVSNWESMALEASSPDLEAAIGGVRPWIFRRNSPVHKVDGVSTAVLILHGEKDERVPLAQGLGLYRALKKSNSNSNVEMVIYPREPHGFVERKHAEDVLQRVLDHFAKWL